MSNYRDIKNVFTGKPTLEGAGVRLSRLFGYYEVQLFDPFLLLDDFHSNNPDDYIAGFPWHPHRGIETVTYMLNGEVEHGDSIGNKGIIKSGDLQWMTAGSGIIHQEMPLMQNDYLWGFQLWVNLPAGKKMINPRYRGILSHEIPMIDDKGVKIRVISGKYKKTLGPVKDLITDILYLDIEIPASKTYVYKPEKNYNIFAYVIEGSGIFNKNENQLIEKGRLVLFKRDGDIKIKSSDEKVRFLLIAGMPINEPVAWRGPIVMNTQDELALAFEEYYSGTFVKNTN